jgi:hypothetical protein
MTDDTEPDIAERTDADGWTRYAFREGRDFRVLVGRPVTGDGWVWWRWTSRVVVDTEERARNLVNG